MYDNPGMPMAEQPGMPQEQMDPQMMRRMMMARALMQGGGGGGMGGAPMPGVLQPPGPTQHGPPPGAGPLAPMPGIAPAAPAGPAWQGASVGERPTPGQGRNAMARLFGGGGGFQNRYE